MYNDSTNFKTWEAHKLACDVQDLQFNKIKLEITTTTTTSGEAPKYMEIK